MDMSPLAEQVNSARTIRVTRGLFVLRYVSSKAGLNAPTISVATPPGSDVDVICPGDGGSRLVSPGDGVVVRAARDALLNLTVVPSHINGSCDAELVLERVSTTMRRAEVSQKPASAALSTLADIELLAHVARRGDVVARAGEWICGPQLPMAIEGLEIRWPGKPPGLDIVARATINARGLRQMPEQPLGSFLGTRGKAAPITSLTLALAGPGAGDYALACEALFLGMPVMRMSGSNCTFSGATGWEPLVGLRLSVTQAMDRAARHATNALREQAAEPRSAPVAAAEKSSRVRVFRSARAQAAPALVLSK